MSLWIAGKFVHFIALSLWIVGKFVHFSALCLFGSLVNFCTLLHCVSLDNEDEASNTAAVYNAVQFINRFITVAWCRFVHFIACCFFGPLELLCTAFSFFGSLVRVLTLLYAISLVRWYVCAVNCMLFLSSFGTCAHFTVCYLFSSLVRVYVISTLNNEDEASNTAAVYNAVQFVNRFITVAWCNFVPVSTKSKNSPYFSTTPIPLH